MGIQVEFKMGSITVGDHSNFGSGWADVHAVHHGLNKAKHFLEVCVSYTTARIQNEEDVCGNDTTS